MNNGVKLFFLMLGLCAATPAAGQYTLRDATGTPATRRNRTTATTPTQITRIDRPIPRQGNRTDAEMTEHMPGITDNIPGTDNERILYLTFNLPGGGFDIALINWLDRNRVPATFFISCNWVFPETKSPTRPHHLRMISTNPLFSVQNAGYDNLPASENGKYAWGIRGTENLVQLRDEIMTATEILRNAATLERAPTWYRAGAAMYDTMAVRYINSIDIKIAGFAINIDAGGTLDADQVYSEMMRAKSGDILSGMANRPNPETLDGFSRAVMDLKQRGFVFKVLPEK